MVSSFLTYFYVFSAVFSLRIDVAPPIFDIKSTFRKAPSTLDAEMHYPTPISSDEEKGCLLEDVHAQHLSSLTQQKDTYPYYTPGYSSSPSARMPTIYSFVHFFRTLFGLRRGTSTLGPNGIPLAQMRAAAMAHTRSQDQAPDLDFPSTSDASDPALLPASHEDSDETSSDDPVDPSAAYGGGMYFSPMAYKFWGTNLRIGQRNERQARNGHMVLRWMVIIACLGFVASIACLIYISFFKPSAPRTTTNSSPSLSKVETLASIPWR